MRFLAVIIVIMSGFAFANCPLDEDPIIPPYVGVEGVQLDRSGAVLYTGSREYGNRIMLIAAVIPANASNKAVTWSSSDSAVVTVEDGEVTAVGAGNACITATTDDGGFIDTCTIEVIPLVYYSDYGAAGDGETDDFDAIIAAHTSANLIAAAGGRAKVMADPGKTYYIGGASKTSVIQTDTDWGDANFIIDDTKVSGAGTWIFRIESAQQSINVLNRVSVPIVKNQAQVTLSPPLAGAALLVAVDYTTIRYIRSGSNANNGGSQRDVFIIDKDGIVDTNASIIWDFNNISSLTAYPIDEKQLAVTGGRFTTIADDTVTSVYMSRGIQINRSNTLIEGLRHTVINEITQIRPYSGFLSISTCANVTVQNCMLTGRRVYNRVGTYDIVSDTAVNLKIINCGQTNSIADNTYWGIFASNYSKNILFDNVSFSRFDAHQGVYNATIKNSELGHQGLCVIGSGTLRIENTKVWSSPCFIEFRSDYGSSWEGNVYIENCTYYPPSNNLNGSRIFDTGNDGRHNYGYPCTMPEFIYIDGFRVEDNNAAYNGIELVTGSSSYGGSWPYTLTDTIFIKNYSSPSGIKWRFTNSYLRSNIKVIEIDG